MRTQFSSETIVAIGSNLCGSFSSQENLIEEALEVFLQRGLNILKRSKPWRSAAWPDPNHPEFCNVLVVIETTRSAMETLAVLQGIEQQFGRVRHERNGPRTLDLDLIAVGKTVMMMPELTLPHPRAYDRRFVMGPLAEIAPNWVHPVLQKSAVELAAETTIGTDATPMR